MTNDRLTDFQRRFLCQAMLWRVIKKDHSGFLPSPEAYARVGLAPDRYIPPPRSYWRTARALARRRFVRAVRDPAGEITGFRITRLGIVRLQMDPQILRGRQAIRAKGAR